jgi:pectinesterase
MKKSLKILSVVLLAGLVSCNNTTSSSITSSTTSSVASSVTSSSTTVYSSSSSSVDPTSPVTVTNEFIAGDLANATLTGDSYKINSAFSIIGSKVTYDSGSSKTITNLEGNSINSNGRLKNFKQDGKGTYLQITVSGDNAKLLVNIASGGSSKRTLTILDSSGTEVYTITKEGDTEVFTIDISLNKGIYTLGGDNGYNLYYAGLSEEIALGNETGFIVDASNVSKNLFVGETLSLTELDVYATYESGAKVELSSKEYTVDTSNVNTSIEGDYVVTIKYKSYTAQTFTVNVSTITDFEISDFVINGKVATRLPKVYKLNDTISKDAITVVAKSSKTQKVINNATITLPSTSTAGAKQIEVKVGSITKTIDITVIDSSTFTYLQSGDQKVYFIAVNSGYTDGDVETISSGSVSVNTMKFSTIQNALDYIKTCGVDDAAIKNIEVSSGTYKEKLYVEVPNVSLSCSSNDVIIEYDAISDTKDARGNALSTYGSSTVTVLGANFYASGITFKNSYFNTMDEYNSSTLGNKQGCALVCDVDAAFNNCKFVGFQDTLYARLGNQIYKNCSISGMTDYIFGETANAYFLNCKITSLYKGSDTNNGYIATTKPSSDVTGNNCGFVFNRCDIKGEYDSNGTLLTKEGTVSLARPWSKYSKITYANCTMDAAISTKAYGDSSDKKNARFEIMSGVKPQDAKFSEYNNSGEGSISSAVTGGSILTETEYNSLMTIVNSLFSKYLFD